MLKLLKCINNKNYIYISLTKIYLGKKINSYCYEIRNDNNDTCQYSINSFEILPTKTEVIEILYENT